LNKEENKMKHRLLILISLAVLLFSLGSTLVSPAMASAADSGTETPTDLCNRVLNPKTATGGGQTTQPASQAHIDACVKGVNAAIANGAKAPSSVGDKSTPCYKSLYKGNDDLASACNVGYFNGYQDRDTINQPPAAPGPGDQNPDAAAQTGCINGVWGGDTVTAKAANNGDLLKACIVGYEAQQNGKSESDACSSIPSSLADSAGVTYCQKGYEASAGANVGNNDNPPDCESVNDSFNISWAICPIIEGLANATDGMYTSIIQPLLVTKPININNPQKDPSNTFAVWSNFRLYGNIFLVIALLVVVFGESISGGLIDAYTAKKVLPRLLIAAILINISIYIVALAVDVTNIIGNGIAALMQAPFHQAACSATNNLTSSGQNCFALKLGTSTQAVGGLGVIALVAGTGGTIWALMSGGASAALALSVLGPLVKFLLLFVLLPAFLTFVAIMVTVVLRQGLILFLVFIAPVAFALYCLPNTEQYFRKWWDLLFRTLLIYPLVAIFFALGNILSVTISSATGGLTTIFGDILAITALFVPLFLIPFSFRIAGGVLGRFHEFATTTHKRGQEAIKGNPNDQQSLRNRTKRNVGAGVTRVKAQSYRRWSKSGRAPRVGGLLLGGAIEKEALLTQDSKQRINAIKDNGDDSIVNARASFVDTDGKRKTLDGKEVSEMDWRAAKRLYPTLGEMQAVSEYRASKITKPEQADQFMQNYGRMARQQGLTEEETNGAYTGFSFGRQNEFGHMKYGSYTTDQNTGDYVYHPVGDTKSFTPDATAYRADPVAALKQTKASDFVEENYAKRDGYTAGKQMPEFHLAMADTKAGYMRQLSGYTASGGTRQMTTDESFARDKLKQIVEMEQNFEYGGMVPDDNNPGQFIRGGKGQLQGASAGTQAAFGKQKSLNKDASGNELKIITDLRSEIEKGDTYEAKHSPETGNFDPGERKYRP
jgi:hypothetical protein